MDPTKNPFAPGAGTRPPELAGRDGLILVATIALKRIKAGKPARSQLLLGLRGVGKTVLLNRIMEIADSEGYLTVFLEAPEKRRLAEMRSATPGRAVTPDCSVMVASPVDTARTIPLWHGSPSIPARRAADCSTRRSNWNPPTNHRSPRRSAFRRLPPCSRAR